MRTILQLPCLASLLLLFTLTAAAQMSPHAASPIAPPPPSVPPALLTARTVFVSNAGADSGLFPSPFSGDPDRSYQQFYAAIQSWHHYQLVSDPTQADLVLELRLTAPYGPQSPNKSTGASDPLPMFRLVIYDRRTHYILWALTESIDKANLQKNHDKNFDVALEELTNDLKRLTQSPSASPVP
jgi:hypothetical protein